MSKNNQEHRDSTTDFFLNFISKEKEKPKTEEKHITSQSINDEIDSRGRAFVNGAIKVMNFINSTLDRMLQSGLSLKILSFILATILLFVLKKTIIATTATTIATIQAIIAFGLLTLNT